MKIRSAGRGIAALLLFGVVAACGGGEPGAETAGEGGQAAALGGDGRLTIAMIAKSSTNPVFLSARTGAEAAATQLSEARGVPIEVVWLTPPQEDGQVQAQRITQAVNEGADAILLSASDPGKVTTAIRDAVSRGVAVMTFDSDVPDSGRFAFYGVDDMETGRRVMQELVAQMGSAGGQIGILAGNQNAPNLQMRVQGVREEAGRHASIEVAGVFNHPETPQDAAAEVIRATNAYPNIRGWAMIGGWPLFTTALLGELDPERVKIVAVDALPAQLAYVERGLAPVLLAQPTYQWGYVGVETIVKKLLDNEEIPERLPMELVRVTEENLGDWARQLQEWGFTDVDAKYLALPAADSAAQ